MGKRTQLNAGEMLRVMRHLGDVASLRDDPAAQRQLLIDGLNTLVGTDASFFYVADEWRPTRRPHFTGYTLGTQHDPLFVRYASEFGVKFPLDDDPYCYQSIRCRDRVQAWTSRNVIPDRAAERRHGNFMDLKKSGRLRDGIVSFFRTRADADRIVGVGMHRLGPRAPNLSARSVSLATFAVREIERLVERGQLALAPGPPPELPPRLRQVLERLLAGGTPKRIARELGLSVWTVREHIQRLYRRYHVSGRDELTARFISPSGRPAPTASSPPA